ncbi:ATPase [Sphingosinicella sp.]|jgi:F-type H+-transporting ATPase subunit b|uniref:F0F1 ATP synthase subunit B family protein n=1 Tax=Sphingosinicella sp. TaxID=1917971 RepID=UPI0017BD75E9|nr:ATPase [Sphingosinicella sp.]MBA4757780.1 ATPase [Sphingosinicella sp.]MEA3538709.1 ATPase [Pseudomonadota bacterium]
MPQFDPSNFLPQMFWLAIAFAILYFGVVRLTLPKIGKVVDERASIIAADLAAAELAHTAATNTGEVYNAVLAKSREAATGVVGEAKAATARENEAKLAALDAELNARLASAEARISDARAKALGEIDAAASEAAADVVERLTGVRPGALEARAAVDASLS